MRCGIRCGEAVIALVTLSLATGLVLKLVNGFVASERLAGVANMVTLIPLAFLLLLILLAVAMQPFIDRRIARETQALQGESTLEGPEPHPPAGC